MLRWSYLFLAALFLLCAAPGLAGQDEIKVYTTKDMGKAYPIDAPFAEVFAYTDDGQIRMCFALDDETIAGFADDEKMVDEELAKKIDWIGIRYTLGEKDEEGEYIFDYSVPESLLRIAEKECGYHAANERVKSDKIIAAHLDAKMQDDGKLHSIAGQTVTDEKQLAKLQDLLKNASYTWEGKCPYNGILTLTFEDGTIERMYKAIDSCDGIMAGSYTSLGLGKKGNEQFWAIFDGVWNALNP